MPGTLLVFVSPSLRYAQRAPAGVKLSGRGNGEVWEELWFYLWTLAENEADPLLGTLVGFS